MSKIKGNSELEQVPETRVSSQAARRIVSFWSYMMMIQVLQPEVKKLC